MSPTLYSHACRQGGPAQLPVTWDRVAGGARVACPICGVSRLSATIRGNVI